MIKVSKVSKDWVVVGRQAEPSILVWNDINLLKSLPKKKSHLLMMVRGDPQFSIYQPVSHWIDDAPDYDYCSRYTAFAIVYSYAIPSSKEKTR